MLENEAKWLQERFSCYSVEELSPIINLGSSTRKFRSEDQPYIQSCIIEPLERRGVRFIHVDLFEGEGVDIAGDIFDAQLRSRIRAHNPKSIMCANILEHVLNPGALSQLCLELIEDDGLVFATVPFSFPYHLAPIDTKFRPSVRELGSLFLGTEVQSGEIVKCGTFWGQIQKKPFILLKHMIRSLLPWPTVEHWKAAIDRYKWLFRDYLVTCVILRKK